MNLYNTVEINSAFQFLEEMHKLKEERRKKEHPSCLEFFRGHYDCTFRLIPSLFRPISEQNQFHIGNFEVALINELKRTRPDEFDIQLGQFDLLTKMQHYGMKTRLLDITANPAVALFFACWDVTNIRKDTDGEVFVFETRIDEIIDNEILNIITDFSFNRKKYGTTLREQYLSMKNIYSNVLLRKAFEYLVFTNEFYAKPRIISERMYRQASCFIITTGTLCKDTGCGNLICTNKDCKNREGEDTLTYFKDKIKHYSVKETVYDGTDFHYTHIQNGKRYIVGRKSKPKILSELDTIGINESFLFPELQYESKRIINDYINRVSR